MAEISLDREAAMRILGNKDAAPDARVIAACTVAFFETRDHCDDISTATKSIALKLSHMVASAIYDAPAVIAKED